MAYTLLPLTNTNEPTKTSWANQVRENQIDHESRISQNESDISAINNSRLDFWSVGEGITLINPTSTVEWFRVTPPSEVSAVLIKGVCLTQEHYGVNEVALGSCHIYVDISNMRIKGHGIVGGGWSNITGSGNVFKHDDWIGWNGSLITIMGGDSGSNTRTYLSLSSGSLILSHSMPNGSDPYYTESIEIIQIA